MFSTTQMSEHCSQLLLIQFAKISKNCFQTSSGEQTGFNVFFKSSFFCECFFKNSFYCDKQGNKTLTYY